MKKTIRLSRLSGLALGLMTAGVGLWACSGEFKTACPEGTTQTAGGGDVDQACTRNDQLAGRGGANGSGGEAPTSGSGGVPGEAGSAGSPPVPPGAECSPAQTRCADGKQQICSDDGSWGAPSDCDLSCDEQSVACVVPTQLATNGSHVCARLSDGTVRCWGSDQDGGLGNGTAGDQAKPKPIDGLDAVVALDRSGSCATLADGTTRCWGSNARNRLDSSTAPIMQTPTSLSGATGVAQVAVGPDHVCVMTEQKTLLCRGSNIFGLLGNDVGILITVTTGYELSAVQGVSFTPTALATTGYVNFALAENGSLYCWGHGTENRGCDFAKDAVTNDGAILTTPTLVPSVTAVRSLSSGNVPCVIGIDGRVTCWGQNSCGQLGRGSRADVGTTLAPAPVAGLTAAVQVSSGGAQKNTHVCAVKEDQSLVCWGSNQQGQLGNTCGASLPCETIPGDNTSYVPTPNKVPLDGVVEVATGGSFTCARTADAKVYCWGDNSKGQLGRGTTGGAEPTPAAVVWK